MLGKGASGTSLAIQFNLLDGQLIKDDEGRDHLKAMPEAKRSSMFPDPWRTNPWWPFRSPAWTRCHAALSGSFDQR